jgi:hypothetical protein
MAAAAQRAAASVSWWPGALRSRIRGWPHPWGIRRPRGDSRQGRDGVRHGGGRSRAAVVGELGEGWRRAAERGEVAGG